MVEMSLFEASNTLDSRLARFGQCLSDSDLEGLSSKSNDSHYKADIQGIRSALRGDYEQAAKVLLSETEFVKRNPTVRSEQNGVVAMSTTMCAVSLLKLGKFQEAENLLRQEQQLDAINWNKQPNVKEINRDALRVALLKQGKFDEAALLGKSAVAKAEMPVAISKGELEKTGNALAQEFNCVKSTFTVEGMVNLEAQYADRIRETESRIAQIKEQYNKTTDVQKKEALKAQFDNEKNFWNRDTICKLEIQGMRHALAGEWDKVETPLKEGVSAVDKCEKMRHAFPDITEAASSMYAYYLLRFSRYDEAEKRFRNEVERDRSGNNTGGSVYKHLNELGLRYALIRQGKFEELAKLNNVKIGEAKSAPAPMSAPAPRAVFLR